METLARRRRAGRALLLLSVAVHLAGVLGFYWVPVEYASTTYISENALQAGSFEATMMEGGTRVWTDIKSAFKANNGTADWVESQLGDGSTFRFTLARDLQSPRTALDASPPAQA